jgi:hypothetical protein
LLLEEATIVEPALHTRPDQLSTEDHPASGIEIYDRLAQVLAEAYTRGDKTRIREVNWEYGTGFGWDHEPEAMQRRLPTWFADPDRMQETALADARGLVAHALGFSTWAELQGCAGAPPEDPRSAPIFVSRTPPFYTIDWNRNRMEIRGPQSERDWDRIFGLVRELGISWLHAGGLTDAALSRLPTLDALTRLEAEGGAALTDDGLAQLARLTSLEELQVGGPRSPITGRGLAFLRDLPKLRRFQCCWAAGVADAGMEVLAGCNRLEDLNLMGTHTGDGVLRALSGNTLLRRLHTGREVTDRGIPGLHSIPAFESWQGGEAHYDLMSVDAGPTHLALDGPFSDAGLAQLAGLDGLFGLTFFLHCPSFTADGISALRHLPRLAYLGCQGDRCDDAALAEIARLPQLRMLMRQDAVATDEGFLELGTAPRLEYFWGRRCPNLTGRGFAGFAAIPTLRGLAVNLQQVDDASLARLPSFPALRELMPSGVSDIGFRHVGACEQLEGLWCMYCRDTTDAATEHLTALSHLRTYYAGSTRITDRSLEILGDIPSLERVEFWACNGLSDTGFTHLARLPRLSELRLDGLQGVSRKVLDLFPPTVTVTYSG